MTGPFGSGAFGTSVFSNSPLFTTKDIIDSVLRHTGHSSPSQETAKRAVILGFVNNRYARVTTSRHWNWLYQTADFNFEAPYDTGTITVTEGSAVITGSGTGFSAYTAPHWKLVIGDKSYNIESIDSNTQITMKSEYVDSTESGKAYKLVKTIYQLPADCESMQSLLVDGIGELVPLGTQEFRRKQQYETTYVGTPRYYSEVGRRSEDGVRYVEIYPAPEKAFQCHLDYGVNIMKLEDSESNYPLIPDRHRVVLYYGALAEMYRYLRDAANYQTAEADFTRCLLTMQGDAQLTDSKLILSPGKNYRLRRRLKGRYRYSMDASDFSKWE